MIRTKPVLEPTPGTGRATVGTGPAIEVAGLGKSFGETAVLAGVGLSLEVGGVFGLLGPNGAGKTTTVRILTGVLRPDHAERLRVLGRDLPDQIAEVRPLVGVQTDTTLYERLTALDNLTYFGRLFGMGRPQAESRAAALLEGFGLADRQHDRVGAANPQVSAPVMIVPLLLVIVLPVALLIGLRFVDDVGAQSMVGDLPIGAFPGTEGLGLHGQIAYVCTVYLFAPFFLIIPTIMASVLAANSFAGEKERHSLEGLLYTPISDSELIIGKAAGAAIPSILFSWTCFAFYGLLVNALGHQFVGRIFFPTASWWILTLLLVPAVAVCLTLLVVWVSSRVSTYQAANSMAGFAVLPIVVLIVGQVTGAMIAGPWLFTAIAAILWLINLLMLRWLITTLDRERLVATFL
jgi:ABC-2 type transport system permease protein